MNNTKLNLLLFAIMFTLFATSCTKQVQDEVTVVDLSKKSWYETVDDVKALELNTRFDLSPQVYTQFLDNLVFIDNQLRGFYYKDIIANMTSEEEQRFWSYFKITVQKDGDLPGNSAATNRDGGPVPMLGGPNVDICHQMNSDPFTCSPLNWWTCINFC
ncbi:MAG: hypothetical protein AAF985_07620 [Bacteroidota bacterium]